MKDKRFENEQLEGLLRRAHSPEASAELKQRVTAEATKVWRQTSAELSWRIPIRRLVASAAAAVLIVSLTNYSSDRALDRWRSGETFAVSAEYETLPEMPYGPFAKHLAAVSRKPSATNASALRDYIETVRRALDESPQNGVLISPAPAGGSSRLAPAGHGAGSYS
jgi:cytochrome c-type biogenesis protein CcmH/NrfG